MIFSCKMTAYRPILWAVGVFIFFDLGGFSDYLRT
nr:MAG TPA: hypothetical protein [Caudoviricetes sp.]